MKIYLIIVLTLLSLGIFSMIPKYNLQPQPLSVTNEVTIQPIVENDDMEIKYQYIRTIKLYYKDLHYCSDSTYLSLISDNDSISLISVKRMSCQIVSIFNLSKDDSRWIKTNSIKEFGIYNRVTDNYYKYSNPNQYYLKGLLLRYNKTYEN